MTKDGGSRPRERLRRARYDLARAREYMWRWMNRDSSLGHVRITKDWGNPGHLHITILLEIPRLQ